MNVELLEQSVSKVAMHRQHNVSKVSVAILLRGPSVSVAQAWSHHCLDILAWGRRQTWARQ